MFRINTISFTIDNCLNRRIDAGFTQTSEIIAKWPSYYSVLRKNNKVDGSNSSEL